MFATMLFTISIVALAQFGLYYWRAVCRVWHLSPSLTAFY